MRKLLTNFIGASVAQPIKKGTLDHLQLSYQEAINALAQSQIGKDYDPTKVYILYGCVNSDTAPDYDISAGAVFYDGEVYLVDAVAFTAADTAVGTITTSYFADATADPVTFTDGVAHNVHEIKKMVIADGASGSGEADFDDFLNHNEEWQVSTSTAGATLSVTGTITSIRLVYKKFKGYVILDYQAVINITGASGFGAAMDIPLPIPAKASSTKQWNAAGVYSGGSSLGEEGVRATVNRLFLFPDKLYLEAGKDAVVGPAVFNGQITYEV